MTAPSLPKSPGFGPRDQAPGTFSRLFLGTDPARRPSLKMWATSFVSYVLYFSILGLEVLIGTAAARPVAVLAGTCLLANLAFYALIRDGYVQRRHREREVGMAQLIFGMMAMWGTYAVSGPAAPSTTIIMGSHIIYASFNMTPAQVRRLTAFSLIGLAGVMVLCVRWQPDRFPVEIQVIALLYAMIVMPLTARLASSVTAMQQKLRQRGRELQDALEMVKELATRDELTGLHNRRHMTELLDIQMAGLERSGGSLCLALLDIDLFKSINDRLGHAAGDVVLARFAATASSSLRKSDLVARWGGEEFLVAFPDTHPDTAQLGLERLRAALVSDAFADVDPDLRVTFSAGLVRASPGDAVIELLERADQAMYRAKTNGRDRVESDVDVTADR